MTARIKYRPMYADRRTIATCLWCGESLVDGAAESGWTGKGPDYMTKDGDYGCDLSPDTDPEEGVGSHTPNRFETWDGHVIRVTERGYEVRQHKGHKP